MIGYPLDSHVEFDTDGTPIYDRAISSAPLRKLYKQLFSDGVMPNPSTNMQVSAGEGMNVIVSPGFALCNGCMKLEEAQRTLAVQASSTAYDRIDTVVLRLNDNDSERICDLYILQGVPATSPVRPTLTRTESIWELGLADLFIAKNSTALSNQRITDTRYETSRCGIMSSISEFDTETLYQQVQADLAGFKAEEQADFIAWFENIKGQLSEDAAGNLQNQIGSLPSLVTEIKTSLVAAINWVADKLSSLAGKIGTTDISKIGDGTTTGAIAQLNTNLSNHTANKTNPHGVTKEQIGLGNVNNTSDTDKHVKYAESANCANFLNDGKYEFTTATLTEKFAKGIRLIGIYQQDITLAGGGTFFQSIPSQYQNPAYIYTINCAGNSLNFLANMETYAMAVRNISSDTLSTTVQVYAFAAGL